MAGSNILVASSISPKILYSGQLADTTQDIIYTVPSTGSAIIKAGTVTNSAVSGGSTIHVSISLLRAGQVPGSGTHRIISNYALTPGQTLPLRDYLANACLGPGDFVAAQSDVANLADIVLSGLENT